MKVLSIVHQRDTGSGVFADAVAERGHELDEWAIFGRSAPPAPLEDYGAVLVFGGAMHVDQEDRHGWLRDERRLLGHLVEDGVPVMGVCLGGQLLAKALSAHVRRMPSPEIGWFDVELTPEAETDPVFSGIPERFPAFQWHSYHFELPESAVPLVRNDRCLQAFRAGERAWAMQFHAEVTLPMLGAWAADDADDLPAPVDDFLAETASRIGAWNEQGRQLCSAFLEAAAS